MQFLVLIPGLVCLLALYRGGTRYAFLNVYLPVLLFVPTDFYLHLPHVTMLSFIDTTLFSLGLGMIVMDLRRWRFSPMDLLVVFFLFTSTHSEAISWGLNGAFLRLESLVLECLFPYMAGKLLIEQPGMREETIGRFVLLLTIASALASPEFFLKLNPYIHFYSHFFPGQFPDFPQLRRGFGRVGGPYEGSEQAGMVLVIGLFLALWLHRSTTLRRASAVARPRSPFKRAWAVIFTLTLTLLMTQSRGPWIGSIVALAVASIGRARRPLRRAVLVFSLGLIVGVPLYSLGKDYISGPGADVGSERQTAQYRALLIDNYVPFAKLGGAWGWGSVLPVLGGEPSIDNEYLLIWLTQGYVGLIALVLIFVAGILSFARLGILAQVWYERYLIFTLLGILLGLTLCLGTVWLAAQTYQLFFLLVGWSQAIRPIRAARSQPQEVAFYAPPQPIPVRIYS